MNHENERTEAMSGATNGGLVWTKERPTVPGRWWRRGDSEITRVVSLNSHWIGHAKFDYAFPGGEWAGPIPEPAEPPKPLPRRFRCHLGRDEATGTDWLESTDERPRYELRCGGRRVECDDLSDLNISNFRLIEPLPLPRRGRAKWLGKEVSFADFRPCGETTSPIYGRLANGGAGMWFNLADLTDIEWIDPE